VVMKIQVSCDVTSCPLVNSNRCSSDGSDKKGYPGPLVWRSVAGRNSQVRQSYLRK
jgi:hypothetical protein